MKLISPQCILIPQPVGLEGVYKQIEVAGRVAYKSENRITEDSAKRFVDILISNKHGAPLEHGTVYLYIPPYSPYTMYKYRDNPYSDYVEVRDTETLEPTIHKYITTNYRVITENGWEEDLQYICEPTKYHKRRHTIKFILSRAIANEFVRHRGFSFTQESTRYCNYSKSKFESQVSFINPSWSKLVQDNIRYIKEQDKLLGFNNDFNTLGENFKQEIEYIKACCDSESYYLSLLDQQSPQQARDVLPLGLKTELIMTGTTKQWEEFLKLRCANDAHPDAKYLANRVKDILETKSK